jgi:hypothetical protein
MLCLPSENRLSQANAQRFVTRRRYPGDGLVKLLHKRLIAGKPQTLDNLASLHRETRRDSDAKAAEAEAQTAAKWRCA